MLAIPTSIPPVEAWVLPFIRWRDIHQTKQNKTIQQKSEQKATLLSVRQGEEPKRWTRGGVYCNYLGIHLAGGGGGRGTRVALDLVSFSPCWSLYLLSNPHDRRAGNMRIILHVHTVGCT